MHKKLRLSGHVMNSFVKNIWWFVSLNINQSQAEFETEHVKLSIQKEQIFVYILHVNLGKWIKLSHVEFFWAFTVWEERKRLSAIRLSFNYLQDFSLNLDGEIVQQKFFCFDNESMLQLISYARWGIQGSNLHDYI